MPASRLSGGQLNNCRDGQCLVVKNSTLLLPEDEVSYLSYLLAAIDNPSSDVNMSWATSTLFSPSLQVRWNSRPIWDSDLFGVSF